MFLNNYFCHGLMQNVGTQPVFCAYLSKSESECSLAMKQAVRNAFEKKLKN